MSHVGVVLRVRGPLQAQLIDGRELYKACPSLTTPTQKSEHRTNEANLSCSTRANTAGALR